MRPASAEPRPDSNAAPPFEEATPVTPSADQAVALHDEARALYEQGKYRHAIAKLEDALALDPHGKELVYNLALIHEKLAEVDAAERYYRRYLEMETDPEVHKRVEAALRRLEGARADLTCPRPSEARPLPTNPSVMQRSGSKPRIPAKSRDRDALPFPARMDARWPVVVASVSTSALAAGALFGVRAIMAAPGKNAHAGRDTTDLEEESRRAHGYALAANVSFVIAAVAGGAAVTLHLVSRASPPRARARTEGMHQNLDLALGPGHATLSLRF